MQSSTTHDIMVLWVFVGASSVTTPCPCIVGRQVSNRQSLGLFAQQSLWRCCAVLQMDQ